MEWGKTNMTFPFRSGLRLRIVAHPGRWMTASERDALVSDLRRVADASVPGGPLRYGVLSGEQSYLDDAVLCVAYERRSGLAVAFNAATLLTTPGRGSEPVLHIGLCIVREAYRSRGLCLAISAAGPLSVFVKRGLRPLWVTNVTQVPAAAGVFASMADADAFVIRDAYTGGSDHLKKSYAQCVGHRDGAFGRLCLERLDYRRGDDLLQVGRLTLTHALRVSRKVLARAAGLRRVAGLMPGRRIPRPTVATTRSVS
jgi:hypothetical protein